MNAKWVCPAVLLLLLALFVSGCVDVSCATWSDQPAGTGGMPAVTSGSGRTTTSLASQPGYTDSSSTTSTSTTTTTLSPLEAYKAEMRAWRDEYGAELSRDYSIVSGMKSPLKPTDQEIQAAKDLDELLAAMVDDLEDVEAPPELAERHAEYLSSTEDMAKGVHQLAEALSDGKTYKTLTAIATIAAAWEKGEPAREGLEAELGFSLSG